MPSFTAADLLSSQSLQVDTDRPSALGMSDILSAYQLAQPSVSFTSTIGSSQPNIADVATGAVDFSLISSGLTAAQHATYPQLQMFPVLCSSVVPIYRLDGLVGATLVLSRAALAGIYAGSITWWNDSVVQATNSVALPSKRIRVVYQNELSAVNSIFITALSKFQPGFPVKASSTPTWPLASYAAYGSGIGVTGVSAAVLTMDGSIGCAPQSNALAVGVNIASLVNWAGQTVVATPASVTAAITEITAGYSVVHAQTLQLDYTDGHGALSWPICILTNLLVDMSNSRGTCHQRAAVVAFWTWYYTSSVPAGLLAQRQYSPIPAFLLSQLDPVDALQTQLMCRGSPAYTVASASARTLGVSNSGKFLLQLFSQGYESVDDSIEWQVQPSGDELVMDQLLSAEVDVAFFTPGQTSAPFHFDTRSPSCRLCCRLLMCAARLCCLVSVRAAQRTWTSRAGSRWWTQTSF